jgi:hypothetical protein
MKPHVRIMNEDQLGKQLYIIDQLALKRKEEADAKNKCTESSPPDKPELGG